MHTLATIGGLVAFADYAGLFLIWLSNFVRAYRAEIRQAEIRRG